MNQPGLFLDQVAKSGNPQHHISRHDSTPVSEVVGEDDERMTKEGEVKQSNTIRHCLDSAVCLFGSSHGPGRRMSFNSHKSRLRGRGGIHPALSGTLSFES